MEDKEFYLDESKKPKKLFYKKRYNINLKKTIISLNKENDYPSFEKTNTKNNTIKNTISNYFKNPFFFNDNNLNLQLKILKELNKMKFIRNLTPGNTNLNTNYSTNNSFNKANNNHRRPKINIYTKNNRTYYKDKSFNLDLPNISIINNKEDNNIKLEINDNDENNIKTKKFNSFYKFSNSRRVNTLNNKNFKKSPQNLKDIDEYFYEIIFKSKPLFKFSKKLIIDNKFNMIYAENEEQYKKIIEKEYIKLLSKGKKVKSKNNSVSIRLKLKETKNKIKFMKGIMDYSYPGFVLSKIKNMQKKLNEHKKNPNHKYIINGMEKRNKEKEERNNFRKEYLLKSITLYK